MTKQKLHETVLALCVQHKANKPLTDALSELTKPKVGGSSDVNDYTVFDTDGNVTHIFCTYHKLWEPVIGVREDEDGEDIEFPLFKINEKTKNGYERECTEGTTSWREQTKVFKTTNDSVIADMLEGAINNVKAKGLIADATAARAIHIGRADKLGDTEKPGGATSTEEDAV